MSLPTDELCEIGRGVQYRVFDIGNKRILKAPLTPDESQAVVESWASTSQRPQQQLPDYLQVGQEGSGYVQQLIRAHPHIAATLGNPQFESNGHYTQDFVTTLGDALTKSTFDTSRQIIDKYIGLILLHWRYGFCERVFNFTLNNGIDANGEVILLDFGELSLTKVEVAERIAGKRWQFSYSCTAAITPELREYYLNAMQRQLTYETLTATWSTFSIHAK